MSMKKNTGYTLIELMTMLAVVAILLTVGVPQLKVFFQSNQMVSNTNDLVTALNLARAEAIRRGSRATVCKSSTGTACRCGVHLGRWLDCICKRPRCASCRRHAHLAPTRCSGKSPSCG